MTPELLRDMLMNTLAKTTKTGRPRKNNAEKNIYETTLYKTLLEKLPPRFVSDNRVQVRLLANELGVHHYTIYRWMDAEARMSVKTANKLLVLSQRTEDKGKSLVCGKLTREDLLPHTVSL